MSRQGIWVCARMLRQTYLGQLQHLDHDAIRAVVRLTDEGSEFGVELPARRVDVHLSGCVTLGVHREHSSHETRLDGARRHRVAVLLHRLPVAQVPSGGSSEARHLRARHGVVLQPAGGPRFTRQLSKRLPVAECAVAPHAGERPRQILWVLLLLALIRSAGVAPSLQLLVP